MVENEHFRDLASAMPLPLPVNPPPPQEHDGCLMQELLQTSCIAPFRQDDCTQALRVHKKYVCGGNLWWCGLHRVMLPNLPVNAKGVHETAEMMRRHHRDQLLTGRIFVISVTSVDWKPGDDCVCLVAEEDRFALLHAAAKDVNSGASNDVLLKWRQIMLTWILEIHLCTPQEALWKSIRLRLADTRDLTRLTALGSLCVLQQIVAAIDSNGIASCKKITQHIQTHLGSQRRPQLGDGNYEDLLL